MTDPSKRRFGYVETKNAKPLSQQELEALQALADKTWEEGPTVIHCKLATPPTPRE